MKAPIVVVAGLFLTGCVATDPAASLRSGTSASFVSVPAPNVAEPLASVAAEAPITSTMPGDLLIQPARVAGSTDPLAILDQRPTRVARTPSKSTLDLVARAGARPSPLLGAATGVSEPVRTAGLADMPLPAAYLPSVAGARATGALNPSKTSASITLTDVEARAEAQQKQQNTRDRHFDAQVRRASNRICSTCLAGAALPSRRRISKTPAESEVE